MLVVLIRHIELLGHVTCGFRSFAFVAFLLCGVVWIGRVLLGCGVWIVPLYCLRAGCGTGSRTGMDFHALLGQIQELEHAQREEEAKLIREKLQHENTKTELEKG